MEQLKKLKETIEGISYNYDINEYYTDLLNATIDYQNETHDWIFESLFEDVIDYEIAEMQAKHELEDGGLLRLYYFLGDANLNNEIFKIDGYGNLTDIEKDDLDCIKDEILDIINDKLEEDDAIQYADEMERLNDYYIEEREDGTSDNVIRLDVSYTETFI